MGYSTQYEQNLVALIKTLRVQYGSPNAKFVTASLGQTAQGATDGGGLILDAMENVADATKYPEFKGNVAAVYTDFEIIIIDTISLVDLRCMPPHARRVPCSSMPSMLYLVRMGLGMLINALLGAHGVRDADCNLLHNPMLCPNWGLGGLGAAGTPTRSSTPRAARAAITAKTPRLT